MLTDVVEAHAGAVPMVRRKAEEIQGVLAKGDSPMHWGQPLPGPSAHHVHQYLRLLRPLGGNPEPVAPVVRVDPGVTAEVRERFGLEASRRWVGINAGAEYGPAKRWPAEAFRWLVGELVLDPEMGVAVFGGAVGCRVSAIAGADRRGDRAVARGEDVAGATGGGVGALRGRGDQ
jgi:ADP-heptose:LPS heptosyltransferase